MKEFICFITLTAIILNEYNKDISPNPEYRNDADSIINAIQQPVFPDLYINILDFGAVADGKTLCTPAINNAIDYIVKKGGGTIIFPKGKFLTGSVHLKSNVKIHLEENAELNFSTDNEEYLPVVITRWEGIDCYNYSPFIYGYGLENIAITGKGKLNGMADNKSLMKDIGNVELTNVIINGEQVNE